VNDTRSRLETAKSIFCDIDGTLVDSNEFHIVAWDEAFRSNGFSISRHVLRQQIGKGADKLIPTLAPDSSESLRKTIREAHGKIFQSRFLNLVRPFPYASEFIRSLHTKAKKVLLVSSSPLKEVEYYADRLGVTRILADKVGIDDVGQSKPAPDLFETALTRAQVDPRDAIAVGDTPYDVSAAANCGIAAIAVRTGGFSERALEAASPFSIEPDIGTLYRFIR
jgi:membrane protein